MRPWVRILTRNETQPRQLPLPVSFPITITLCGLCSTYLQALALLARQIRP